MKNILFGFLLTTLIGCASKQQKTTSEKIEPQTEKSFADMHKDWKGTTQIKENRSLEFIVSFSISDGTPQGTISIPNQMIKDLPLSEVKLEDGKLFFMIKPAGAPEMYWAKYSFDGVLDNQEVSGFLEQGGRQFETILSQTDAPVALNRPQMPTAPFPYTEQEVAYINPEDKASLAGTLTMPTGDGPHPAVLLISGSGQQDRDSSVFGHKPFWVIADHLTRQGIAVLRMDDRGTGKSTGVRLDLTSLIFAQDVEAGVEFLASQSDIDAKRIGLIGHSEGGMIAPIVASQRSDVSFLVLLAGPGVNGLEVLTQQNYDILKASGISTEDLEPLKVAYRGAMSYESTPEEAYKHAVELIKIQAKSGSEPLSQSKIEESARKLLMSKGKAWLKTFLTLEPSEYLTKVKSPVLALNGSLDLQVSAAVNLAAIEKSLKAGGNQDFTVQSLEGLNHMFQQAQTGLVSEYEIIEETFNPKALNVMTDWILLKTKMNAD